MTDTKISDSEITWRQYALTADFHKTYISGSVQLATFVYAITGGIVSYSLVHADVAGIRWSLLLPLAFNSGASFLSFRYLPLLDLQRESFVSMGRKLGFDSVPSYAPVRFLTTLLGTLYALTAVGIGILLVR